MNSNRSGSGNTVHHFLTLVFRVLQVAISPNLVHFQHDARVYGRRITGCIVMGDYCQEIGLVRLVVTVGDTC